MISRLSVMVLLSAAFVDVTMAEEPVDFTPETRDLAYYRIIWEKSPFVARTSDAAAQGPALAQRFALTGLAALGDRQLIFLLDRNTLTRVVVGNGKDQSGVQIVSIQNPDRLKEAAVTIRLGNEEATLKYDPGVAQVANQPAQPPAPIGPGGGPPGMGGQPPAQAASQNPGSAPQPQAPRQINRRRLINFGNQTNTNR
ncbi:hypothetical protein TSACC_22673 [Terrimicrobium sacchariphilum]|uniref:Uncharacterized protein n=1 Tax=Terrimicrobium sacchariphilum TaxID=690879 RepID=A0A146GCH0_TERSA|nr:hypothetical protein [Terrimicrobium sacchariphilum]GAT34248.1 hypothetical protein TSACC_22673 [Terrimicrobium sacchariphilum]